jgi:hypothetical protein
MSSQVKKFSQCELRDKKHQYFSIISLLTDSVIVDHPVYYYTSFMRRLIVTRVGCGTMNAVRSAPTERVSQCLVAFLNSSTFCGEFQHWWTVNHKFFLC